MIYNVALVSCVQQSHSVIHIHIFILFQILFSYRLSQNTEFPVLYSRPVLLIHLIYSSVYVYVNPNLPIYPSPPLPPPRVTISLFSTSVTLFLFCR